VIPLAARFAARELRAGVRGFRIFLACLALGVAAIAAAGSTAEAFRQGLAAEARDILGGDLAISAQGRRFSHEEQVVFARAGRVAYAAANRAMAEAPNGERRLVELRGVSPEYPVAGRVSLTGATSVREATARRGESHGAAVEAALAGVPAFLVDTYTGKYVSNHDLGQLTLAYDPYYLGKPYYGFLMSTADMSKAQEPYKTALQFLVPTRKEGLKIIDTVDEAVLPVQSITISRNRAWAAVTLKKGPTDQSHLYLYKLVPKKGPPQ